MRILHVTHNNGEQTVILTNRPDDQDPFTIVEAIIGPLSTYNSIDAVTIRDPNLTQWPQHLPTETPLYV